MSAEGHILPPFLSDQPLTADAKDALNTDHYASLIYSAILASPPPMTIGLFGQWGIGKSTILLRLEDRLAKARPEHPSRPMRLHPVLFDAWKYEGDALRRQLVMTIADALRGELSGDDLAKLEKLNLETKLYAQPRTSKLASTGMTRRGAALLALNVVVAAFVAWGVAEATHRDLPGQLVFAVGLLPGAVGVLNAVLKRSGLLWEQSTLQVRGESIEHPEEFERAFRDLASIGGGLVVLIDNLDRCENEIVLEVLRTVKTFLEPPGVPVYFVIACDATAIRQHVEAHAPEGIARPTRRSTCGSSSM